MKKIALFDMDGTLTDTERVFRDTWMELPQSFGVTANPDFPGAVCGSNGENMLKIIHTYYPQIDEKLFMDTCFSIVDRKNEKHLPLKEGVIEILRYMKENGFKIAVTSSNYHEEIEKNLEIAGILSYFDLIMGGDDVSHAKPDPDIYLASAAFFHVNPEECYAFEDGLNGLRSALSAGCRTYMVIDLTEPDDEVAPKCAGIYRNFYEVLDALKKGSL